ncbi:MAG TPA: DUF4199 domain-containing protein [Chitinophagaceae bacterium]
MLQNISPAIKGLITAIIMIAVSFALYNSKVTGSSPLLYLPYLIYGLGIVWTLVSYKRSPAFTGKFKDLFSQGFKCFIVITLVMIVFIAIFLRMQPQFKEESMKAYRETLIEQKSKQAPEIDAEVARLEKQFNTSIISASIFGYLIIGCIVTAGCSALLTRRNQ